MIQAFLPHSRLLTALHDQRQELVKNGLNTKFVVDHYGWYDVVLKRYHIADEKYHYRGRKVSLLRHVGLFVLEYSVIR